LSSQTSAGSLDSCLQKTILVSDNNCAQAIIDLIGWNETQNQVKAAGFSSTNVNNSGGGYMSSTAADLASLLKGLYDGSLLNTSSTDYLLNLMKQQVYRSGIPAGSPNAVVADKVGFLDSWNHDAAIVYAPNSTYVLVILTTNSSFSQIKALSNQIYNLYNQ
jgi:beta-lactamase class A